MSANLDGEPPEKKTKTSVSMDENTEEKSECKKNIRLNDSEDEEEKSECKENILLNDNEDEEETSLLKIDEDGDLEPFPPDNDVTEMIENVHYNGLFPTITERYFTAYYKLNVQSHADDVCILMHSNRICMLTLAPSHIVLQSNKEIKDINFKVSDKLNRVMNKVSGKSKHGAQPLQANSKICIITSSSGETYTIKCCIIGKLVEVNEALLKNPKLLLEPPHKGGYLAIVLPNIKLLESMKKSLLTQEQYDSEMLKRQNTMNHFEIKIKNESETDR
ncbi:protein Abitram [Lasioglossum baleicum]|uniref:protein Abitram n=1 Tax=Lasioglossum baleicum TaxID=434251 RepID=UPI003FCD25F3